MKAGALLLGVAAALAVAAPGHGQERPTIVSLDYCADQYVLGLADRAQILALSPDADADFSALREAAAGLPQVHSTAEDVLALQPDLVVRSYGGDARALALFERAGIAVHQIGYTSGFDDIARVVEETAAALGRPGAGEALVAAMRDTLQAAGRGAPVEALYITPGGATAGAGTTIDALLRAAGFENAAGDRPGWREMPMERLLLDPPDLIVTGFFDTKATKLDHWSAARHPVLQETFETIPTVHLQGALLTCGTWLLADAALSARVQFEAAGGQPAAHLDAEPAR
ncbi:ABC transporter substrate-binding protein [Marinicauda algicola]|uniref:ABC transporter substrate-binding protein n=1 Tax=Marinicauda algicola TaxID=2029849 RepID=A0A4S2H4L3_9PROT|nr:ABC transporter substrate-binding protein [Marinicauda algicola]TGY90597.1 ABC transporter substrate-binding protein [Marinicauda algicola]